MKLEKKYYIFTAGLTILSILMAIANTAQPLIVEQFINQLGKSEQNVLFWAAIYFLSILVILTVEMIRKLGEAKYVSSLKDWFRVKVSNGILNRTAQQLFRNLTIVSQVPYMFSGTVKDNITLFGKEDVKKLNNYSMLVDDSFWKLIYDDREISNESTHISNGEREKIALLRAFMRQSSWLILDEATAALDKKSKQIFEKYILDRDDMTVLHISHNFQEEDAKMYDEIIVIGE